MKTFSMILIACTLPLAAATTSWAQCDCGAAVYDGGCGAADYDNGCDAAPSCGCEAGGCNNCGCNKVCRLIRTEKFVTSIAYGTRCKDICVPGCTMCGGGKQCCDGCCDSCCDGCCCCGVACGVTCGVARLLDGAKHLAFGTCGCAKVKTVKQLVKYEVTKRVCGYKWVVVDAGCCHGGCDGGCDAGCDGGYDGGCGAGNGCAVHNHASGCGCADYGA